MNLADDITLFDSITTSITDPEDIGWYSDFEGSALQWVSKDGDEFRWYWEDGKFLDLLGSGMIYDRPYKRRGHVFYQIFADLDDPTGAGGIFYEMGDGEL